jgi:hypothetical protein
MSTHAPNWTTPRGNLAAEIAAKRHKRIQALRNMKKVDDFYEKKS